MVCDAVLAGFPQVEAVTLELKKARGADQRGIRLRLGRDDEAARMSRAVLGLGTNLGDRGRNLAAAVEALGRLPETAVARVSSVWQTAPFDVPDEQQDYWNICVLLETGLSPRALLGACLGIEAALGARAPHLPRRAHDRPRPAPVRGRGLRGEGLTLPHPGIRRAFVLFPLRELFPALEVFGADYSRGAGACGCRCGCVLSGV